MNKFTTLAILLLCLAVSFKAANNLVDVNNTTDMTNPNLKPDTPDAGSPIKCHATCNCDQTRRDCAQCNICSSCKDPNASIVSKSLNPALDGGDYCVCNTPYYTRQADESCKVVTTPNPFPECEWQLFNQITNMVVHSNCDFKTDEVTGQTYVRDVISYDWQRITKVEISDVCKDQLKVELKVSLNCNNVYTALPTQYTQVVESNIDHNRLTTLKVPLINIYQIAASTVTAERHIYQRVCFALLLSNDRVLIRTHRFEMRVYTNRDQLEVFHLDVSPQLTDGCDEGQECVLVANLDTVAYTCKDSTCNPADAISQNSYPLYVVGDHMYVRIKFADLTYKQYLTVISVKFIDTNVYVYQKGSQWWTHHQEIGYVDVEILLFQPHLQATIEIALKIQLHKDGASYNSALTSAVDIDSSVFPRQLQAAASDSIIKKYFTADVIAAPASKSAVSDKNFAAQLVFGALLSVFALLI